jgi:anti-sigma B factor antagonist
MSIHFEVQDTEVRVTVAEVDRKTLGEFEAELADGLRRYQDVPRPNPDRCTTSMVVDLRDVEFLDSSGIRALLDSDLAAARFGGRVVLIGARGIARRCLEVTGVLERMQHPAERWTER